jgi:hypothetical protein
LSRNVETSNYSDDPDRIETISVSKFSEQKVFSEAEVMLFVANVKNSKKARPFLIFFFYDAIS